MTTRIDTVVIGAGHAGLAVSHLLSRAGRDHVVLDRGRIAERWRSERWDSLHLLTPRWMTRLPGWQYSGAGLEGFMPKDEFVRHLERYASESPLALDQDVLAVDAAGDGYHVVTDRAAWQTSNVVIATGPGRPYLPPTVERLGADVRVVTTSRYRNPEQLTAGGVLVVGASASGVQIADELARSGRRVVLSTGNHNRMPRRYRGMDIFWWLEQTRWLERRSNDAHDAKATHPEPSLQLAGRDSKDPRGADVDLRSLHHAGVELVGRLDHVDRHRVTFRTDLATTTQAADARMHRFLDMVDTYVELNGLSSEVEPPDRPQPFRTRRGHSRLNLRSEGISTVILATGFRPHHPWLRVPVLDERGAIRQSRGVTAAPGLYVVGQRYQRHRGAPFIDSARHSAHDVVTHLCTGDLAAACVPEPS